MTTIRLAAAPGEVGRAPGTVAGPRDWLGKHLGNMFSVLIGATLNGVGRRSGSRTPGNLSISGEGLITRFSTGYQANPGRNYAHSVGLISYFLVLDTFRSTPVLLHRTCLLLLHTAFCDCSCRLLSRSPPLRNRHPAPDRKCHPPRILAIFVGVLVDFSMLPVWHASC